MPGAPWGDLEMLVEPYYIFSSSGTRKGVQRMRQPPLRIRSGLIPRAGYVR
jgi:hypothetical protein